MASPHQSGAPPPPPLEFQVLTYDGRDVERIGFDMVKEKTVKTHEYIIDAYGRTADGRSVCVHVTFPPYGFISVQDKDQTKIDLLWAALTDALDRELKDRAPRYVARKRFYGFTDGAQERFLLLRCQSLRALRIAGVIAQKRGFLLFETNVPPPLRLLHMRELPAVGWVRCNAFTEPSERCTICDIEVNCSFGALDPMPERTSNAPLVVASYDIECISESGGFPNALEAGCPIIQIATTFWRVTDPEPYKRYLACLGAPLPIEGVDIDACATEQQLLMAWAKTMRREQVDMLIGYNTFGFDNKYVFDRAALKGALGTRAVGSGQPPPAILNFPYLMAGKRTDHLSEIHVRKLESSAYGQNEFFVHSTPGVLQIDLLAVIKKEYKLTSYKLDAVSAHFLGDNKVDLPIKEMFALYKQGTPEALQKIASYCVKDTELPIRLMRKLAILPNMMEMAKAVHVPIDYLIFRGQQIKVFSVILKKARENGFVCPAKPLVAKSEKYTGATVLEAKTGAHFGFIACLDFASLYPSIIRAHNMCHSTVVLDRARYGSLHERVNYETHDLGNGQSVTFAVSYKKGGGEEPVPSLLPSLLADLAEYRKEARKLQKQAKEQGDEFMEAMYNGKQLAYKVTMNSLYGFCGAANGLLPCVPIAAAVTTVGRGMIDKTRKLVEQYYAHLGASVVYGDSVAGYTPTLLRLDGRQVVVMPIEELADAAAGSGAWLPCSDETGKEACELSGECVEVWTEAGWTKVQRVIRHAYNKPLVRVITPSGLVDVTEDHSLLLADATAVRPRDVEPGLTQLLHAPALPSLGPSTHHMSADQARIMGMFYGGARSCCLSTWAITSRDRGTLERYKRLCEAAYPCQSWCIYQTMDSQAAPFSLVPFDAIGPWVAAYDEILQDNKVPMAILRGPPQVRTAFMQGLKDSDVAAAAAATTEQLLAAVSYRTVSGYWAVAVSSQVAAMTLVMLAESLATSYSAQLLSSSSEDLAAPYSVVFVPKHAAPSGAAATVVKKMHAVPCTTDYVYDLTTANHHFHAGIGRLIVHNTDSVMCDFKVNDLAEAFRLGEEAARRITSEFRHPIELEFEKIQSPFLLYSKKRYASLKFTDPNEPGKVDAKGISLVRRDSCGLVRDVTKQALDLILIHRDPKAACAVIHDAAKRLLAGQVPLEELVMSKALRGAYKAGILQPHDVVRGKIAARSPGEEPRAGDRVQFVYCESTDGPKQSVTCRAEDPKHVEATGMLVDYFHYYMLLKSALDDTIDALKPELNAAFAGIGDSEYKAKRAQRELHYSNARTGQREITSFFVSSSSSAAADASKQQPDYAADPFVEDA